MKDPNLERKSKGNLSRILWQEMKAAYGIPLVPHSRAKMGRIFDTANTAAEDRANRFAGDPYQ